MKRRGLLVIEHTTAVSSINLETDFHERGNSIFRTDYSIMLLNYSAPIISYKSHWDVQA